MLDLTNDSRMAQRQYDEHIREPCMADEGQVGTKEGGAVRHGVTRDAHACARGQRDLCILVEYPRLLAHRIRDPDGQSCYGGLLSPAWKWCHETSSEPEKL